MGGGLLQLVAYGAQDVYLTGNPQITFFKVVYRRHTNFALESIQQTFNGSVGYGSRVTSTIARNGDLISRAYLVIKSSAKNLCPYFGLRVIKHAEVEIGGQKMDKHYSDWMYIWNELSLPVSKKEGYFKMVGGSGSKGDSSLTGTPLLDTTNFKTVKDGDYYPLVLGGSGFGLQLKVVVDANGDLTSTIFKSGAGYKTGDTYKLDLSVFKAKLKVDETLLTNSSDIEITLVTITDLTLIELSSANELDTLYVPLEFWFCRNIGLALPLIALQYHEVKINIQFEDAKKCTNGDGNSPPSTTDLSAHLWVDYVYLDTDERRKFAQTSHEYLIEQLQFTGFESLSNKVRLNFNHPVKELIWTITSNKTERPNENWFNYTNNETVVNVLDIDDYNDIKQLLGPNSKTENPVQHAKLLLNGNDRFTQRDGMYFNMIQPFQHHENIPNNTGINVYSFALKPEEHQPSGTLNMSRIDTSFISLDYDSEKYNNNSVFAIYAINYNVLRILSGMGGIAYSN
tara:strand:- start:13892 stop:15427 length:1536 start_codon:yes stop_codon:yes gene_type:complete